MALLYKCNNNSSNGLSPTGTVLGSLALSLRANKVQILTLTPEPAAMVPRTPPVSTGS
ncbi:hypothetical protein HMPREF1862_00946 [Varibaculum cambriense]|uniref:Uncharacterized protein n=1 Tax=Varibaculum cambriense TaxID=184870 RepID=A0AB34WZ28_9ACTO|nr:hypothetical protein HMPREF1862_00946 [Varibaculum cambriense]